MKFEKFKNITYGNMSKLEVVVDNPESIAQKAALGCIGEYLSGDKWNIENTKHFVGVLAYSLIEAAKFAGKPLSANFEVNGSAHIADIGYYILAPDNKPTDNHYQICLNFLRLWCKNEGLDFEECLDLASRIVGEVFSDFEIKAQFYMECE